MNIAERTPQARRPGVSHNDVQAYNYDRFHPGILGKDVKLIRHPEGPHLGETAPDFKLKDTQGKEWHLQELQGKPVVLIIGSGTCPLTQGNLPGLQALHKDYGDRCTWLMLYVREAHPGENMPAHQDYEQKRSQAEYFGEETGTHWPILVDDLDGSVHKEYGLLPNSTYLIDADGNVSFIGEISHGPTLRQALEHLFDQNMRGTVPEGDDKMLHMLGPTAYGWEAIERGGRVSMQDVSMRMPPLAMNLWLGHKMKPLLDPLARRSKPLEAKTKAAISFAATAAVGALMFGLLRGRRK
jgi:thiol-disulfide isomerase/thioredoxin